MVNFVLQQNRGIDRLLPVWKLTERRRGGRRVFGFVSRHVTEAWKRLIFQGSALLSYGPGCESLRRPA